MVSFFELSGALDSSDVLLAYPTLLPASYTAVILIFPLLNIKHIYHLQENIRVRRAGFAYRAEFHRFLSRFGILSPLTYPEWRGSDRDGCKKILAAASKRIKILTKEEVRLDLCLFL